MNHALIVLLILVGVVTLGLILYVVYMFVVAWSLFEIFTFPFQG